MQTATLPEDNCQLRYDAESCGNLSSTNCLQQYGSWLISVWQGTEMLPTNIISHEGHFPYLE